MHRNLTDFPSTYRKLTGRIRVSLRVKVWFWVRVRVGNLTKVNGRSHGCT